MGLFELVILSAGVFAIYRFYLNESQYQFLREFDVPPISTTEQGTCHFSDQTIEDDNLGTTFDTTPDATQPMDSSEILLMAAEDSTVAVLPPRPSDMAPACKDRTQVVLLRQSLAKATSPNSSIKKVSTLHAPLPPEHMRKQVPASDRTTIQSGDVAVLPQSLLKAIAS